MSIFRKILTTYEKLPFSMVAISGKNPEGFLNKKMKLASVAAEEVSKYYITYRVRPKNMDNSKILHDAFRAEKIAIVIQGPIMESGDFTLQTAIYYRKCYPSSYVIVSTWNDTKQETVNKMEEMGIYVVLSSIPDGCGHLNINYQVTNTLAGIKKAKELGAKFICKTRTDQRIYHPNGIMHLLQLINTFPVNNSDFTVPQHRRIVSVCMPYGDLFYPYCISDFLYFGTLDDMEQLFSLPFDTRDKGKNGNGFSRKQIAENMIAPEIQIIRSYIQAMGGDDSCTVKNYWQFIKNHMVMINKDEIGLFWPKYEGRYSENTQNGYYYMNEPENAFKCYNFDFINWLLLYNGTLEYKPEYEKYADYIL